jgi:hypothetical protein
MLKIKAQQGAPITRAWQRALKQKHDKNCWKQKHNEKHLEQEHGKESIEQDHNVSLQQKNKKKQKNTNAQSKKHNLLRSKQATLL